MTQTCHTRRNRSVNQYSFTDATGNLLMGMAQTMSRDGLAALHQGRTQFNTQLEELSEQFHESIQAVLRHFQPLERHDG